MGRTQHPPQTNSRNFLEAFCVFAVPSSAPKVEAKSGLVHAEFKRFRQGDGE